MLTLHTCDQSQWAELYSGKPSLSYFVDTPITDQAVYYMRARNAGAENALLLLGMFGICPVRCLLRCSLLCVVEHLSRSVCRTRPGSNMTEVAN